MQKAISLALIALGVVLLIFGYNASQSISSEVTRAVTGSPTDKVMWLIGGGAAATVAGIAGLFLGKK